MNNSRNVRSWRWLVLLSILFGPFRDLSAHQASDSYLTLRQSGMELLGRWDLSVQDLDLAIDLDSDRDGFVRWSELSSARSQVEEYAFTHLNLELSGVRMKVESSSLEIEQRGEEIRAVLKFRGIPNPLDSGSLKPAKGSTGRLLSVHYTLLEGIDDLHRGLVRFVSESGRSSVSVLGHGMPEGTWNWDQPDTQAGWPTLIGHGIHHIVTGTDHLLFLLALLLPGVVFWRNGGWEGESAFGAALMRILKVVSAFTAAHSITFALAASGCVSLPSKWVESVIAISVVFAGLNNIRPLVKERGWWMAFGFGLVHGFGFAGALGDLGVRGWELGRSLIGFNLGVELAQLLMVLLFLPVAYAVRHSWVYRRMTVPAGSGLIVIIALVWVVERVFDVRWFPA